MKKAKKKEEKDKIKNNILILEKQKKEFNETGIITQKNINDYTYDLVRKSIKSESCRRNIILSYVFSELIFLIYSIY